MTTSQDLLCLTVAALKGDEVVAPTDARDRVFSPGDWPTQSDQYPLLKVRLLSETKQSLGKGGIMFRVTATIRILAEVSEPVQFENAGATAAEIAIWRLVRQCECGVINSYPLTGLLQEFPSIRTELASSSESATHLAGAQIDIDMEFIQDANDFAPLPVSDLTEIEFDDTAHPGAGLTVPLSQ
ncbi:hypothetical protein [Sphingomonas sp. CARO-RG-8B-R24-01]|uniref:hypothetical protein n=1 Tax=Sphingomonas sp. CARO-RG-8B-R24-01 TaxID=2914831 RepID=UPI001F5947C5|nr:hypothetical protein [Sphingomonas sp. CARO-RG-8B-R24-01]